MRKRGQKSAAELSTAPPVDVTGHVYLKPPDGLDPKVRKVFAETVLRVGRGHLTVVDTDLLCRYAEAVVIAREAFKLRKDDAQLGRWERATRQVTSIAGKLKLTPAARAQYTPADKRDPRQGYSPAEFLKLVGDDAA